VYEIVPSTNGNLPKFGFTVFDGPPDGKTAMRITSMDDLTVYAKHLNVGLPEALTHATQAGWLDLPTANQWLASIPQTQPARIVQSSVPELDMDRIIAGIKNASVGEIAFFLGLGLLAWAAISELQKKTGGKGDG